MQPADPYRLKESIDKRVSLPSVRWQQGRSKSEKRVEREESRWVQWNSEKNGLASQVLAHPATLGGTLTRTELAVGVEKGGVKDRHGIDGEAVALSQLRKLSPRQIGIGRFVVEVEPDDGGRHPRSLSH